jgi:3-phenylpropionate/trans-cinnamate dioxygenase ferredoxin reductase subunit
MTDRFVIIGAGLAGAKAAQTLRAESSTARIVLIGEEPERPYERPPLSKDQLLGTNPREDAFVHPTTWYAEHDIDLRIGVRAESIDRAESTITLAGGETIPYDRLLLTTGSSPRRLDVPGSDLDRVFYLRTIADADRLKPTLVAGAHVVVIGAGWIGLEVAAAARTHGADVHIIETAALPLQRVLGDEVARIYEALHVSHGVTFHGNASVREVRGDGSVSGVVLDDGTELPADLVVVGVGIRPNVELAEAAGLAVDNGITANAALCTSDPHIFAAGDVANAWNPLLGRSIRVEHWDNALKGGPAAAKSMLGQDMTYDHVPYFYSDQYELSMEYSGYVEPDGYDRVVFRGDPSTNEFLAFWVKDERVLAGMNANIWDVQEHIQALVRAGYAGTPVDVAKLADPDVPLGELTA